MDGGKREAEGQNKVLFGDGRGQEDQTLLSRQNKQEE